MEQLELLYITGGSEINGISKDILTLEKQAISFNIKHIFTTQSSNATPKYLPKRNKNICAHKIPYRKVYISFTHNFQKLKINQMSNNWEIYKEIMVYDTIECYSTIERKYLYQQQHSNSNIKLIKPSITS